MKLIFFFSLLVLFSSCNPTKKAIRKIDKIKQKHPELFELQKDTVLRTREIKITPPVFKMDTFMVFEKDTALIETDSIKIQIVRDTLKEYKVEVKYVPKPIIETVTDTVFQEKEYITTEFVEVNKGYKYTVWIIIALLVGSIAWYIYNKARR